MSYIETKTVNKNKYYYLVKEIRRGDKKKKFRTYLGKGKKSQKQLNDLKKQKEKVLDKKIDAFLSSKDFFYSLLSQEKIKKIDKIRSDYKEKLKRLHKKDSYYEWFITKYTYDTNAIEGSTLTEQETGAVLFEGILPKGKNLREVHEAENHKQAFDYMLEYKKDIDLNFILKLHKLLMHNILLGYAGKLRDVQVYVRGAEFIPPKPDKVKIKLKELIKWYNKNKKKYHPVVVASYFHTEFEEIHPFRDGNGRVGRLLLNFILMRSKYPPIDIKNSEKIEYYEALEKAHHGDIRAFVKLVTNYLLKVK